MARPAARPPPVIVTRGAPSDRRGPAGSRQGTPPRLDGPRAGPRGRSDPTSPVEPGPPPVPWYASRNKRRRSALCRNRRARVTPLDVTLEDPDELVDEAFAAERSIEPAVDEHRRYRLLERAR